MLAALPRRLSTVTLAIFDLDNTLLGGDSDNLWGQFVCERGLVDGEDFAARNDQFYADYKAGTLDIDAYLRFALSTLVGHSPDELEAWHRDFMASKIEPILLPKADQLLASHRRQGHELLIITATNEFITRPIAQLLGVPQLIACEGEIVEGRYTGEPRGVPSYHAGHAPEHVAGGARYLTGWRLLLQRLAQRPAAAGDRGPPGGGGPG